MTILHVTDLHFNPRWYHWLIDHAPRHDLLVISGDLLDRWNHVAHRDQRRWVADWVRDYASPLCLCSGRHDLEWDDARQGWRPAYWLRDLAGSHVWVDGQRVNFDGLRVAMFGATITPKGGASDLWVVHAPPQGSLVARRVSGCDAGDPDLARRIERCRPAAVLAGRVHYPVHWTEQQGETLLLNPGRSANAGAPNHILLQIEFAAMAPAGGGKAGSGDRPIETASDLAGTGNGGCSFHTRYADGCDLMGLTSGAI